MTYVGDGKKRTQKKEKGLDIFSKKKQRIIEVVSTLRPILVYASFKNWPSVKQYK